MPSKPGFPGSEAPFRPIAEQLLRGGERRPAADFQSLWLMAAPIRGDRPDSHAFSSGQIAGSLRPRSEWTCFSAAFE
jgi:hypothetical protein